MFEVLQRRLERYKINGVRLSANWEIKGVVTFSHLAQFSRLVFRLNHSIIAPLGSAGDQIRIIETE